MNTESPSAKSASPFPVKSFVIFVTAVAVMAAIMWIPPPEPLQTPQGPLALTAKGKAALAVLALAVILWATEAIPFAVTALMALLALVLAHVDSFKNLVAWGFGDRIILFFLGVLIFSAAIAETHLLKRFTLLLLFRLGHQPRAIILAFLVIGTLTSAWITDMAVAALLMPIGVSILRDAGAQPLKSNFGRSLMIACAWGPLIGGIATPAGCGPNPLTMKFLKDLTQIDFTFTQWMLLGFPAALLMIPCAYWILVRMFPPEPVDVRMDAAELRRRLAELGPITWKEVATIIIFVFMVVLWIFPNQIKALTGGWADFLEIELVALGAAILFFLPGINVIGWKKAETEISWGGIILIAAGLSLGQAIHKTGAAQWLAYAVFHKLGLLHPVLIVFAVAFGISLLKVVFSSNTVTGVIMVPLMIELARNLNLDPRLVAIPAGITASLAFILVTSTPTNVIPYSSGYFSIRDMVKAGVLMTVASAAMVTLSIAGIGKLFGIVAW